MCDYYYDKEILTRVEKNKRFVIVFIKNESDRCINDYYFKNKFYYKKEK